MGKKTAAFMVTGTLLVAACGDDGGGDSAFCDSFEELNEWTQADVQERTDEFTEAARAIDPPSEIADEWNTFVEGMATVSSAESMQEELADDPEAMQEAVDDMQETQAALDEAGTTIDQYANDNCDFE